MSQQNLQLEWICNGTYQRDASTSGTWSHLLTPCSPPPTQKPSAKRNGDVSLAIGGDVLFACRPWTQVVSRAIGYECVLKKKQDMSVLKKLPHTVGIRTLTELPVFKWLTDQEDTQQLM